MCRHCVALRVACVSLRAASVDLNGGFVKYTDTDSVPLKGLPKRVSLTSKSFSNSNSVGNINSLFHNLHCQLQ